MGKKQNFLLQEVIDDLIDTEKSLSKPLMKLLYFGKLIHNQELIDYTRNELEGYNINATENNLDLSNIPEYRKTIANFYVDFRFGIISHYNNTFPISLLPEKLKDFKIFFIPQGVDQIESLIVEIKNGSKGNIESEIPIEFACLLQEPTEQLYKNPTFKAQVIGARSTCNPNFIISIPNNIRVRLLEFVMKIADEFGYNIEIDKFNKDDYNNQIIIENMNNIINNSGDGNVINMGNNNQNENDVSIYKGDLERLKKELDKLGIQNEDIEEISKIVQEEPLDDKGELGEKSKNWIKKILSKIVDGASSISGSVSVELLSSILKGFLGV